MEDHVSIVRLVSLEVRNSVSVQYQSDYFKSQFGSTISALNASGQIVLYR